ncbi:hypothetical protein PCASD_13940 [Puccinia coronata f. sp. avenae]|uniref:Uncharacterized protein n=1 Tax=Puccinia coronata f. sp. avenae TaxID=200324 RepID=A0A2N5UHF7_9BASI|nr:hypothetical protein PCASD_13940 [Puccinia coronata f. sp. avenae]
MVVETPLTVVHKNRALETPIACVIPPTVANVARNNATRNMDLPGKAVQSDSDNTKANILRSTDYSIPYCLGPCNMPCNSCGALHWREEASQVDMNKSKISYTMCCQKNKVTLPGFHKLAPMFPAEMKALFDGTNDASSQLTILKQVIHKYLLWEIEAQMKQSFAWLERKAKVERKVKAGR